MKQKNKKIKIRKNKRDINRIIWDSEMILVKKMWGIQ